MLHHLSGVFMKKLILSLVLSMSIAGLNFAQDGRNLYTIFVNIVNEEFHFPLLGLINIAEGSHSLPQIGFVNWNKNNFSTVQVGFINTVGGDMAGLQVGFVNTVAGGTRGIQLGVVNTSINRIDGAQVSFFNFTKQLNGLQLGFINYVDSIENGFPVGFLSIVRNGGYKAVELGVSEISPFNASFKIGVERVYSSFIVSYNPFDDGIRNQIIWGVGLGSIIPIGQKFFFNPEITTHHGINERFQHYLGIVLSFGYTITSNLSVLAGPSLVWTYVDNDKGIEIPFYRIAEHSINDNNKLIVGARMALRFRW
jgi:hypothetical protein